MKKTVFFFSALLIVLISSCSSDDTSEETNEILPKSIKVTYLKNEADNSVITYSYKGKKLLSSTEKGVLTKYEYNGDAIKKQVFYQTNGGTNVKFAETTYKYSGGKLISSFFLTEKENYRSTRETVYTYNTDGTIKNEQLIKAKNLPDGMAIEVRAIYNMSFLNGNLVKLVDLVSPDIVYENEFDAKNNPFKNVTGLNLLLDIDYSSNNLLINTHNYIDNLGVPGKSFYKVEYEYNSDGYPTKKTVILNDGTVSHISEYSY